MHLSEETTFPVTPDMSELDTSSNEPAQPFQDSFTPQSGHSQNDPFEDAPSPSDIIDQEASANAVATPPIAESDLEAFEDTNTSFSQHRPVLNTATAQNASLPSPGLSPTFASAELHQDGFPDVDSTDSPTAQMESQETTDSNSELLGSRGLISLRPRSESSSFDDPSAPTLMNAQSMLETFDTMHNDMKTFMMYQFLRRCPRKTLHVIANAVNPALKCDFLDQLPAELSLHILSFLDYKDLCRAAQVSKQWRNLIDSNETGWKELLDRDGYVLPIGEIERAVQQGWGWQDPSGLDGFEHNLSVQALTASSETDMTTLNKAEIAAGRKGRSASKRKRAPGTSTIDRSKRRAVSHEFSDKAQSLLAKYPHTARFHKSEGPLSAANAAALAVPDPGLGLPSLRKLHLFKSLYRRHYMLRNSWTNGKVAPHHCISSPSCTCHYMPTIRR